MCGVGGLQVLVKAQHSSIDMENPFLNVRTDLFAFLFSIRLAKKVDHPIAVQLRHFLRWQNSPNTIKHYLLLFYLLRLPIQPNDATIDAMRPPLAPQDWDGCSIVRAQPATGLTVRSTAPATLIGRRD